MRLKQLEKVWQPWTWHVDASEKEEILMKEEIFMCIW